jgi:Tfp pilus assembly protein PilO
MLRALTGYFSGTDAAITGASVQEYMRRSSRRILPMLGWPGIVAISILVMCPPLYLSAIRPLQERINQYQSVENALHDQAMNGGKNYSEATTPSEELDEFYKHFPSETESPHWLGKMVEVADKHGLNLNHGEYTTTRDKAGQLIRFKITLPVQGKYMQIRKFLGALNTEIPMMALDNVQFERKDVLDTDVQVKIRLWLYMVQES